jgi:hypothetical protein
VLPTSFQGSILSLFLGPDGGPREGAIRLPPEKITDTAHQTIPEEESLPSSPLATLPRKASLYEGLRKASRTFSGVFASRVPDPVPSPPVPLPQSSSGNRPFPRTSRADGHAYGYGSTGGRAFSFRSRLGSNVSGTSYRRGSQGNLRHRTSNLTALAGEGVPLSFADSELSFAQRLVLANENAVTSIADLWVAAAMNVDNEEVFEPDDTELEGPYESVFDQDTEELTENLPTAEGDVVTERGTRIAGGFVPSPSIPATRRSSHASPFRRPSSPLHFTSHSPQRRRPSLQYGTPGQQFDVASSPRRFSNAIFAHPGVKTPLAVVEAQKLLTAPDPSQVQEGADAAPVVEGKQPSLMSQLPLAIIFQYGWLALHTTTHDMVFLTYVVS